MVYDGRAADRLVEIDNDLYLLSFEIVHVPLQEGGELLGANLTMGSGGYNDYMLGDELLEVKGTDGFAMDIERNTKTATQSREANRSTGQRQ